ncbi:MAG TPA: Stk1 family PASTA domain-containing Ser/Thr kinase [Clostridiaceae bacterium]|nr:Stk1 family PASTA domain-containing Ser/Thr kinase [Clostridiaceae bacterium]
MMKHILGGRYELIEKIGGGGMAVVYKAKCRLLNRFVAVKILRPEFNNDEEFINRFRIEAQAAASLSHPNIVSIYDVGEEEGIHYIVMEYIDGITLKEYIKKKGRISWREATNIAIQICSAIEQAHRNHIVHRDIKPHNIILTADGIAKVTDFGIAKAVTSSTITMVGSTIGSVHYFSPEQARGGFVDEKSDLYSLGIVLYEMVTGSTPFDGETPVAIALKHIQSVPIEPSTIDPNIPRSVNDIIMKAMKKEQSSRYQTATEMLADLHRVFKEPDGDFVVFSNDDNSPTVRIRDIGNRNIVPKEEESEIKNKTNKSRKRNDNLTTWLAVATSVIIILIFVYIGYRIIMPLIFPPPTENFTIENYVGRNIDEVRELLEKHNITVEEKPVFSETKEKGTIISQSVAPGKEFKPGAANVIEFEVSAGPHMIKIPDLGKKEYRTAETDLKNLGLETEVVEENSDTIPTGHVIRTEPGADEEVEPGTLVKIFKSIGPKLEQVEVPNLIGKTFSEVQQLLDSAKLKIGKIEPENVSSPVAKVIEQYPSPKITVEEGTAVDIVFGEETTQEEETGEDENQDEPGNNNDNTGEVTLKRKTVISSPIPLLYPEQYGDEIKVYALATLSDNNEKRVVFHRTVKKSEFPLRLTIPVPEGGKTEVYMELDGEFYTKFFVE